MKIVVNTRLLISNKLEGIGYYTYETLKRITQQHKEHEFVFLFDRPYDQEFIFSSNITPIVAPPPARHPLLFYYWFEFVVPRILKQQKADLFLSPDGYLSLSTKVPSIGVIHDLNFEHYPEFLPFLISGYYRHFFPKFARKATRIVTVSEFSKEDIMAQYGIPSAKIDVTYNGANPIYQPISEIEIQLNRVKYAHGQPYFLFIGSLHPRKNIANMLKAYDLFRETIAQEYKLVIVGEKKWWTSDIERTYDSLSYKEDIIFTNRLSSLDLKEVIASAHAMLYPSFFEGFGIPIVEAYYCDIPVVTSNTSSMPEIAGDAALFAAPESPNSIANAMVEIVNNKPLYAQLVAKGRKRREKFNWQFTADGLWQSMEQVLGLK